MTTVGRVADFLGQVAPLKLAESWDNVGLLLGDRRRKVTKIMTCLTVSQRVAQEAINGSVDLIVSHHPIPFKPVSSITTDSYTGTLLWQLASAGISVYAPHTAWDNCSTGINVQLANMLRLQDVAPISELEPIAANEVQAPLGSGRMGLAAAGETLSSLAVHLAGLSGFRPRFVGDPTREVRKVGICCGSGGGLLAGAIHRGCDAFLTGEATYHTCLEAEAAGVGLLMIGHHASERFSMEILARQLASEFSACKVWASTDEADPVSI